MGLSPQALQLNAIHRHSVVTDYAIGELRNYKQDDQGHIDLDEGGGGGGGGQPSYLKS